MVDVEDSNMKQVKSTFLDSVANSGEVNSNLSLEKDEVNLISAGSESNSNVSSSNDSFDITPLYEKMDFDFDAQFKKLKHFQFPHMVLAKIEENSS